MTPFYTAPSNSDPLEQGDIFAGLPLPVLHWDSIEYVNNLLDLETKNLSDLGDEPFHAQIKVDRVYGVLCSQNCDVIRGDSLLFAQIRPFHEVMPSYKDKTSPKEWKDLITKNSRLNAGWFYLPKESPFIERMAIDFSSMIMVRRINGYPYENMRIARLPNVANDHFRAKLSDYFRRYAYDEWYPLSMEELEKYKHDNKDPDIQNFPWQES